MNKMKHKMTLEEFKTAKQACVDIGWSLFNKNLNVAAALCHLTYKWYMTGKPKNKYPTEEDAMKALEELAFGFGHETTKEKSK